MDENIKIPKKVVIKGRVWKVRRLKKVVHEDGDVCRGLSDFDSRTITIQKGMEPKEELFIFLHEMIHAALAEAHLNENSGLPPTIEEIVCDSIADMLVECFKIEVINGKKDQSK